jgi:hypothetical protein
MNASPGSFSPYWALAAPPRYRAVRKLSRTASSSVSEITAAASTAERSRSAFVRLSEQFGRKVASRTRRARS